MTLLLINFSLRAQVSPDSVDYSIPVFSPNRLFSNFDKQLNTYFLNTGFDLYGMISKFEYRINQNFRSTLVKSNQNSIRDEQYFNAIGKYRINNNWKQGIFIKSNLLSDDRQLAINEAILNQAVLLSEFQLAEGLNLIPYGGYSYNTQTKENDTGPVYGLSSKLDVFELSDFELNSTLRFENEDISPRKNTLRYFDILITNPFTPDVSNFLNARYDQSRKDFYLQADSIISSQFNINNNIESRTESIFFLQDRIKYDNIFDLFQMELTGRINFRTIDRDTRYKSADVQSPDIFDTKVDELGLFIESGLSYKTELTDAGLKINYSERDEKHITKRFEGANETFYEQRSDLESRKNNYSYRTTIAFLGNMSISNKDKFSLSIFHSKLRYDTPSINNDDDRDELLTIGRIRYIRDLTPFFQLFSTIEGTISHIVYLFSGRSANNNYNRVLRFSAGGYYNGPKFSSLNNFEVSANYTVYDFEDMVSNLRSISFRQFIATDSTHYRITNNFSFIVTGYLKLTEQGDLDWGDFAERPQRYLQEIFADPKLGIVSNISFFALGLRYFSLNTFRYNGKIRLIDSEFLSIGPLFEILIGTKMLYLKLTTWYEFISDSNSADRERMNLMLAMNWNF